MLVMTIVQGKLVKGFPSMRYQYYIIYKKFMYNNSCTNSIQSYIKRNMNCQVALFQNKIKLLDSTSYELSSDTISE